MKKLGKVAVVNSNGKLLVKAGESYRINSQVVNQQIKSVGKIVDIIGPVATPYLVINTRNAEIKASVGELLYVLEKDLSKPLKHKTKQLTKSKKKS